MLGNALTGISFSISENKSEQIRPQEENPTWPAARRAKGSICHSELVALKAFSFSPNLGQLLKMQSYCLKSLLAILVGLLSDALEHFETLTEYMLFPFETENEFLHLCIMCILLQENRELLQSSPPYHASVTLLS